VRRAEIVLDAERVLGDRSAACDWLAERHPKLDGKPPWEMSEDDPERVLELLRRIAHRGGASKKISTCPCADLRPLPSSLSSAAHRAPPVTTEGRAP
jgi:hypothetical protein